MIQRQKSKERLKKPSWLKQRLPSGSVHEKFSALLNKEQIHTVCQEAQCPNIWECFSRKTATVMIMGDRCTRNCRFCAVAHGPDSPPDPDEPARIARTAQNLQIDYAVITSVTRDDLSDGGASFFVRTVNELRQRIPDALIELLIPDFKGDQDAVRSILEVHPDVLNHNIETVPRLYAAVRPEAIYQRSLDLLKQVFTDTPKVITKSGLMLGLGELPQEIHNTLEDLFETGCRLLTLGQYLQPTKAHLPVDRFLPPGEFSHWRKIALDMGFAEVA
ncbi:MAG: lipoyl synthase, partial [Deltaproteobacteria bacterium]|nr:lipoyl synthase [Deltaproteobacteria bacterium]